MVREGIVFSIFLFATLSVVFGIHLAVLEYKSLPPFDSLIMWSYLANFTMALLILFAVQKSVTKQSAQSGFIFMGGSGLKFVVFFIFFRPGFIADGQIQTIEFMSFFVPYAVCLTLEVIYLSKTLNNQSF